MSDSVIIFGVGILLSIIGYFVVRFINRSTEKQDTSAKLIADTHKELSDSITKLQIAITSLNGVILAMQDGNDKFEAGCKDKHLQLGEQLAEHGKKIEDHEKRILVIETKHSI